jgi:predicted membrane-bound spermidine synthase
MKLSLTNRFRVNFLAASFGAAALVVQTEILRSVMASAAGGTLAVGATLGAWLCWIGIGAVAGGWISSHARSLVKAAILVSVMALPAGLFGIFYLAGIRQLTQVPAGELIPLTDLFFHSALACGPFAVLVGFSFPIFAGIASRGQIASSSPAAVFIGGLWAAEAAGSFVSGVLFTFILSGRTNPVFNTSVFSVLPLLASLFLKAEKRKSFALATVSIFIILSLVLSALPRLENKFFTLYWSGLGSPGEYLSGIWTRYRSLLFVRISDQTTVFDNGMPTVCFPDHYNDATNTALLLSQHPRLHSVLVIGTSSYGFAQKLLACGLNLVTSIHPDRSLEKEILSQLPSELLSPLQGGSYRYIADDARAYLGRPRPALSSAGHGPAGWDMILLNLDGPSQMNASRFYTPGFFRLARRALGPAGGVLALRLPVGANFMLPAQVDQAAAVWSSLKKSFSHLSLAVSQTHCYFFASDSDSLLTSNSQVLMERIIPYEGKVPYLTRYLLPLYYDPARTVPLETTLEARSQQLGPHTDSTPVAWFHHLRLWARMARQSAGDKEGPGFLEGILEIAGKSGARRLPLLPAALLSLILAALWFVQISKGNPEVAIAWAAVVTVGATGFAAMGAIICLIYLCQIAFGALFYQVAMITATFMLTLAVGSWWASHRAPAASSCIKAVSFLAFMLSVAVSIPGAGLYLLEPVQISFGVWGPFLAQGIFYLIVALVGLFCGALFPWAAALHSWALGTIKTGRTAAALDCADHLGASAGAVTIGVIAVPALGIAPVCSGLALAMICVALFWFAVSARAGC